MSKRKYGDNNDSDKPDKKSKLDKLDKLDKTTLPPNITSNNDDSDNIKIINDEIYFYATFNIKNILKLTEKIQEVTKKKVTKSYSKK